jgi:hypothetical protein
LSYTESCIAVGTVRLDEDSEQILSYLTESTGDSPESIPVILVDTGPSA